MTLRWLNARDDDLMQALAKQETASAGLGHVNYLILAGVAPTNLARNTCTEPCVDLSVHSDSLLQGELDHSQMSDSERWSCTLQVPTMSKAGVEVLHPNAGRHNGLGSAGTDRNAARRHT